MILGFKEFLDTKKQKPTYFREKILAGANIHTVIAASYLNTRTLEVTAPKLVNIKPKLHTIRLDPHNRWKPGMSIQMVYRGAGYKIIDEFTKEVPELQKCVSTQNIRIRWTQKSEKFCDITIDDKTFWFGDVSFDGYIHNNPDQNRSPIEILARNDGFDSGNDFLAWFNKDFKGKIIHWTDFKY